MVPPCGGFQACHKLLVLYRTEMSVWVVGAVGGPREAGRLTDLLATGVPALAVPAASAGPVIPIGNKQLATSTTAVLYTTAVYCILARSS